MRTKTLKLVHLRDAEKYKVIAVKNSTDYSPGALLGKAEVDELCRHSAWDVTIVGDSREEWKK